jgi:AcrR family transcriptional regulator
MSEHDAQQDDASAPKRRRADAERSISSILAAAVDALASDPDASMAEIARRAGVVRATIYVHFPTRDSLLDAVMDYTIADVSAAVAGAEPNTGAPREALERVLRTTWRKLDRLHSLIAINAARLSGEEFHRRHMPFIETIAPVIVRGQKEGAFRDDLPTAWHLSMLFALVHAASGELRSGRISESEVEAAMLSTVLNALTPKN